MRAVSGPRPQMVSAGRSRAMWQRTSSCSSIVLALILFPSIAFASPPDRSWIAGIYDGADGDVVVTFFGETASTVLKAMLAGRPMGC